MIIIDTNILISALLKDGITRKIIITSGIQLAYPETSLKEIVKYKRYIQEKGGYTEEIFLKIMNTLLRYINLIPEGVIKEKSEEANQIMGKIDANDTIFIAAALALKSSIWSEDKDFERQSRVNILKTHDMVRILENKK